MRIDDHIAALRDDPVSQSLVQEQLDQAKSGWLGQPQIMALSDQLEAYSQGQPLTKLYGLREVMTSHEAASAMVDNWQTHFVQMVRDNPLGHVPLKHNYSDGFATMRLFEIGPVTLSLVTYEQVDQQVQPQVAAFSQREQYEIVIAGQARSLLYTRSDGAATGSGMNVASQRLRSGSTIALQGDEFSRQITDVRGCLLVLQLSRAAADPGPVKEIRISDGVIVHQSSGTKRESQISMAMAVLTELGRADAAPYCAVLTQDGPDYLRWDALRHTLALDPVRGFCLLGPIADDADDELAQPARELRDQLVAAHPQLLQMEADQCPN